MPAKYRKLGDFPFYYSGQRVAPYLTIFVSGNHECSNYLYELYYGGWACHNIFFMGAANVLRLGPLRISGMSGIWKGYDYRKPHYERLPYNDDELHSVYHVRELDIRKLLQVRTQVDVGLSHDWIRGIEFYGNADDLFRKKRGFREDALHGRLGNAAAREVVERLRPAYWFSAHLHVMFAAAMPHGNVSLRKTELSADQPAEWAVEIAGPVTPPSPSLAQEKKNDVSPKGSLNTGPRVSPLATGDEMTRLAAWNTFQSVANKAEGESALSLRERLQQGEHDNIRMHTNHEWKRLSTHEDTRHFDDAVVHHESFGAPKKLKVENDEEIQLDLSDDDHDSTSTAPVPQGMLGSPKPAKVQNNEEIDLESGDESMGSPSANASVNMSTTIDGVGDSRSLVDQAIRNKLPASLSRPVFPTAQEAKKTFPATIHNKITRFLALDKPGNRDPYLKLIEVHPISDQENVQCQRPYRLQYDKEWLAITRVFASDLHLGDPSVPIPADLGEEEYLKRILEEEDWVEENLVKKGLMDVPFNFQRSAPKYDPAIPLSTTEQPMEYSNLQTSEFTELLQIPNKFEVSDEERLARHSAGPRPMAPGHFHGGRGNSFWRGPGRGRGGRGGGRGGRSGRGRGRGRGQ